MKAVFWIVLWCSLLYGCATDLKNKAVYNFTWWFGGLAAGGLLWRSLLPGRPVTVLWYLGVYMAIQLGLFSRLYGKADCYAFCVCAIAEASLGMTLFDYLILTLLAVFLLFPIQLYRRNIAKNGNLKRPVAFLPYITTAFAVHIFMHFMVAF